MVKTPLNLRVPRQYTSRAFMIMCRSFGSRFATLAIVLVIFIGIAFYIPVHSVQVKEAMPMALGWFAPSSTSVPGSSEPPGDEWPMFRGALNHTSTATTTPVYGTGPSWSYNISIYPVISSPAVAGGRVYVGSGDGKVCCRNATTGAIAWNYDTHGWVYDSSALISPAQPIFNYFVAGVFSSPAVAGGCVYVGSEDNKTYCLNATTGVSVWNYTTGGGIWSSPAVANGRLYVGSSDHKVYCLNATTGALAWSYTTGSRVTSSPAIASGHVYVGSGDNKTYCLNATTGASMWNYTTGSYVLSSPAVAEGHVYMGGCDNKIYCLNATTGKFIWNYTTDSRVTSSPAVAYGRVFIGNMEDEIYCLDAITGTLVWNFTTHPPISYYPWSIVQTSSPDVANGLLYVGSMDEKVYCLNATTGTLAWSYATGAYIESSPAIAGGHVYIGSGDGKVYCIPMILPPPPPLSTVSGYLAGTLVGMLAIGLAIILFMNRRKVRIS